MKKFAQLIEEYFLQITVLVFFLTFVLLLPLSTSSVPYNYHLKVLVLRCLILNGLSLVVFTLFGRERRKFLSLFPAGGILSSAIYLLFKDRFLIIFLVSFTVTAVISVSLLAFILNRVD
jgi:hypothetical protein